MCGRFTNHTPTETFARLFQAEDPGEEDEPRYNIAPSDSVLACRQDEAGERELVWLRWGLVPFWAKDPQMGYKMINARAESVADKPAFRAAWRRRRCLVAADGFYEWKKVGKQKQPYYFQLKDGAPFGFAGLWEHWSDEQGHVIDSCTIIVTQANDCVAPVHDRMPVIITPDDYSQWLDPGHQNREDLTALLQPYPADEMTAYPIARAVNNPRNEGPQLIEPVSPA